MRLSLKIKNFMFVKLAFWMFLIKMEKLKVSEVNSKFKDIPKNTESNLCYNQTNREITLDVKNKGSFLICCDKCGENSFVQEGAMSRCLKCNSLFLIGFKK